MMYEPDQLRWNFFKAIRDQRQHDALEAIEAILKAWPA